MKQKSNKPVKEEIKNNITTNKINLLSIILIIITSCVSPLFCGGFEFYYTLIPCAVIMLGAFLYLKYNPDVEYNPLLVTGALVVGTLSIFLSVFSPNNYLSFSATTLFLTGVMLSIVFSGIAKDKKWIVVAAICIFSVCGLISLFTFRNAAIMSGGGGKFWQEIFSGKLDRNFGTFINPNFFACYLSMCIPIALGLIFVLKEIKYKLITGFLLLFTILSLCFTGSKFGFVSLMVGLIAFFISLLASKSINKDTFKPFIITAVSFLAVFAIFSKPLLMRVQSAASGTEGYSTLFRVYTWKSTFNMFLDNITYGVFPGRFAENYPLYTIAAITKHAHNSYLQFMSEYGIIISLLVAVGLFVVFLSCLKFKKMETNLTLNIVDNSRINFLYSGFIGAFFACLAHNLVDSDLYVGSISFVFAIICGVLLSFDNKKVVLTKFKYNTFMRFTILLIICGLWIGTSALLTENKDYVNAYKMLPVNYEAIRGMAKTESDLSNKVYYLKKAKKVAPEDYYSYQLLGDTYYYMNPTSDKALEYYEKALEYHPHSSLVMTKLIRVATAKNDTKLAEKYYEKLIKQENTLYETLKGIPEIVDTSYAEAHVYFGDKYLKENKKEKALEEYKKANKRYDMWLDPNNMNFLVISIANGSKNIVSYERNIDLYKDSVKKEYSLEGKDYTAKWQKIDNTFQKLKDNLKDLTIDINK